MNASKKQPSRNRRKTIAAMMIGNALAYFDFTVFGALPGRGMTKSDGLRVDPWVSNNPQTSELQQRAIHQNVYSDSIKDPIHGQMPVVLLQTARELDSS